MAGVAGFEPTITGPKPVALPLGYTPITANDHIKKVVPLQSSGGIRFWGKSGNAHSFFDVVTIALEGA